MSEQATERDTLSELLELSHEVDRQSLHTADIAVAASNYDKDAGTVEVGFPIGRLIPDGSGNFVLEPVQKMKDIPVGLPRTKKFAITLPIETDDSGLIVFAMKNIGAWRTSGAAGSPGDTGTHNADGAVFLPGVFPDGSPPKAARTDAMVMGSESDAKGRIAMKQTGLELGDGATKGVVLASDKTSADTTMAAWIAAAQTLLVALATSTGGVAPVAPTDFGKNGSGSSSTKAL